MSIRRIRTEDNNEIVASAVEAMKIINNILIYTVGGERYTALDTVYVIWIPKLTNLREVIYSFMGGDTRYNSLKKYINTYVAGNLVENKYVKDDSKIYKVLVSHASTSIANSILANQMEEYIVEDEDVLSPVEVISKFL